MSVFSRHDVAMRITRLHYDAAAVADGDAISHSIATTHYLLKKYLEEKILRDVLYNLLDYLTVIPVDVDVLKKGLRSKHKDFEDAIQILCASSVEKIDCIVTRNTKDFKGCEIQVLTPDELCIRF